MIKKETSTITFRIDKENDNKLRKIAESKKVSLNTLANQILGNYVQLEQYMEKFGVILMSADAFESILSALSDKDLINLATTIGSTEPKDFILFKWKELNIDTVFNFIKIYFEHCGYGKYDESTIGGKIVFSVRHKFGSKGSLYIKTFLESLIQSTLDKQCHIISTDDLVTLSISE